MTNELVHKPKHYNHGEIDLIESWYKTYPWDQFVAIMESHIDKYIKRHRYKGNATQDLEKALEYTKRLVEYWLIEKLEEME